MRGAWWLAAFLALLFGGSLAWVIYQAACCWPMGPG